MQIQDLRTFAAVVELGRFTLAAQRLHIVQPAVSQAVMRLERELGLTLLERRPGGTVPTLAGQALWRHAQVVLNSMETAKQDMAAHRDLSKGTVSVGLLSGVTPLILTGLLRRLREQYSGLTVHVEEGATPQLLEGIRLRHLDLAILLRPADAPDLVVVDLAELPLAVAAFPDHPVANRRSINLRKLRAEKWIAFPQGNPGRVFLDAACDRAGFKPQIEAEVTSFSQLKAFVEAGWGLSLLARGTFAIEVAAGSLAQVGVTPPAPRVTLAYAYDPNHVGHAPALVRPLIAKAASELSI